VVAYTHTQIEVYMKRNDSRHTTDLHAMSWMLTASLSCCRSCFACPRANDSGANDSGEEQLLKFSGKVAHSKVSSENSFFLDFNLFYDASSINCQFNPNNSDCSFLESKFSFSHSTTTTPFGRLLRHPRLRSYKTFPAPPTHCLSRAPPLIIPNKLNHERTFR
jgi:hypothetical protein